MSHEWQTKRCFPATRDVNNRRPVAPLCCLLRRVLPQRSWERYSQCPRSALRMQSMYVSTAKPKLCLTGMMRPSREHFARKASSRVVSTQSHGFAEIFVDTLAGTIMKYGMQPRVEIQSFGYRTLQLVEQKVSGDSNARFDIRFPALLDTVCPRVPKVGRQVSIRTQPDEGP